MGHVMFDNGTSGRLMRVRTVFSTYGIRKIGNPHAKKRLGLLP